MSLKDTYNNAKWKKAVSKVNKAALTLGNYGVGYSRTDGIVGSTSHLSKKELKKINAAAITLGRNSAGFYKDRQTFTNSTSIKPSRYTPLGLAYTEEVQKKSYEQANSSMHLRAGIKTPQRINFDPRFQSHPNRRILGITSEEAQEWAANSESQWRDDKELKEWDESLRNDYAQLADMAFWSYKAIGEFFTIRRSYFNNESRSTNISLQHISPFQIQSPFFSGLTNYKISTYNYDKKCLVQVNASEYLEGLKDGHYIENGIEYNKQNQEVAIYISPSEYSDPWLRVDVFNSKGFQQVLHGFVESEPGQKRGIPESATAWHEYMNITDLCLFELESARLNTVIAGTVTSDSNSQANGKTPMNDIGQSTDWIEDDPTAPTREPYTDPNYSVRQVEGGGFIVQNFTPGYKYQELSTSRPNINIPLYIEKLLDYIYPSTAGISQVIVTQRFDGSYNAGKAAIDLSWQGGISYDLKQFSSDYHKPNYKAWLNGKIANSEIFAPGWEDKKKRNAWSSMSIILPTKPSLNPLQEAKASNLNKEIGNTNGEIEAQKVTGTSFEDNVERLTMENIKLADANKPFNPEPVGVKNE